MNVRHTLSGRGLAVVYPYVCRKFRHATVPRCFAYLAKDLVYGLEDHYPPDAVHVRWLPFAFPVEEGFGLPGASSPPHVLSFSFFTSSPQRYPPTTCVTSSFTTQGRAAATTSTRSSTPTSTHGGKNHRNQLSCVCVWPDGAPCCGDVRWCVMARAGGRMSATRRW